MLESPVGQRRRIDVEAGFAVLEVKRDLRVGDAVTQLAGYVTNPRVHDTGRRDVGVLTDGAEWRATARSAARLKAGTLRSVSTTGACRARAKS